MSNLNSIKGKLDNMKKEFLKRNPRKVYIFIDEDELPIRKVKLVLKHKTKIVQCNTDEELDELLDKFIYYERMSFIKLKKPKPSLTKIISLPVTRYTDFLVTKQRLTVKLLSLRRL